VKLLTKNRSLQTCNSSRAGFLSRVLGGILLLAGTIAAAQQTGLSIPVIPLSEIRPGMKGIGRTVFDGHTISEFQVEILGVLQNIAPRQSVILARLTGGPLEETGIMAGMSGSPVYIDGRLAGAVALGFQFSKAPIAGITPIEQMINSFGDDAEAAAPAQGRQAWRFEPDPENPSEPRLVASETPPNLLPPAADSSNRVFWGGAETSLIRVATPLALSGFTTEAVEFFQPQLRALGLVPMQVGGGGSTDQTMGDASLLQPGSMISVQLVRGDLGVSADGTVTAVDQGRIYAFGHRFLSAGPTAIPFAESEVLTALPSYANSMKISTPGRLLGVIGEDRSSGIMGVLGRRAQMVPVEIEVTSGQRPGRTYNFEVVNDRFLLPFLVNMAVSSSLGTTERMVGDSTLQIEQTVTLNGLPQVKVENYISGNTNAPQAAAQSAAATLSYLMQSELGPVDIQGIRLRVLATDRRLTRELERVWSDRREVKPGESLELTALLRSQDGEETLQKTTLEIPASLPPGPLTILVADGSTIDRAELNRAGRPVLPKNPQQLVRAINKLRRNNRLYVRISRFEAGFTIQGENFPSPPPSVARTFSSDPSLSPNVSPTFVSTVGEYELDPLPSLVSGVRTVTILVRN
jgi:hypothetical protein